MNSLKVNYERKIEKILTSRKPTIPLSGINHVDDSINWNQNDIYKGEIAIDIIDGKLYTQDGYTPISLNSEDAIIDGLVVTSAGVSNMFISVSTGFIRINGRLYKHLATNEITETSTTIEPNLNTYHRIDVITCYPDLNIYYDDDKCYGINFEVIQGIPSIDPQIPDIPNNRYLLGVVMVHANPSSPYTLYPLSHSEGSYSTFPLQIIFSKNFVRNKEKTNYVWSQNTLYFKNQIIRNGNILYRVNKTHVSNSINLDELSKKIISLCCSGGSSGSGGSVEISIFYDIGATPNDGSFNDGFFSWNEETYIIDAFDNINEFLKKIAPESPYDINNIELELITNNFSAKKHTDASTITNIIDSLDIASAETVNNFRSYETGNIIGHFDNNNTTTINDTITINPPETIYNASGNNVQLELIKNDHYNNIDGKKGFYKSFNATIENITTLTPSLTAHTFSIDYVRSSTNTVSLNYYIENLNTPTITNIQNIKGIHSGKYLSGVPVLKENDIVKVSFNVNNAIGYFFNSTKISSVEGISLETLNAQYNSDYITNSLPYTALTQVINFIDAETTIKNNAIEENMSMTIKGYNSRGTDEIIDIGFTDISSTNLVVDDISVESGVRLKSGVNLYPTYGTWGDYYSENDSQQSLTTNGNEELQLLGNYYRYPSVDYTTLSTVLFNENGSSISGHNYSTTAIKPTSTPEGYRFALFNIGSIDNLRYIIFRINDAENITEDWIDDEMTKNFICQVKIDRDSSPTGWLNANKAFEDSIPDPSINGDGCLDAISSVADVRRISFGETNQSGDVYVRIGIPYQSNIRFSGVTMLSNLYSFEGNTWNELDLGYFENIKAFTMQLNNAVNITEDFHPSEPLNMTLGLELQARLYNSSNGTDYIDCNKAYSVGNPINFGDGALDVSNSSATLRRITFGNIARSGLLKIRYRLNTTQSISGITITSYT